MGVDFAIEFPCAVREALSTGGIVERVKAGGAAEVFLRAPKNAGKAPSEIPYGLVTVRPEGRDRREGTVQTLLDLAGELKPFEAQCGGCPANITGQPFGCSGYIRYPLPSRAEEWLMGRLPESLDSAAGQFLTRAIREMGYKGAPTRRMRRGRWQGGKRFLERTRPARRRWGGFLRGTRITSDQVLEILWLVGSLEPAHCLFVSLFLGILPSDLSEEDFRALLDRPWEALDVGRTETVQAMLKDDDVGEVALFLLAVFRAGCEGVGLFVDG